MTTDADTTARCASCGEPMPEGESMFKFHGYSDPCPKHPIPIRSEDGDLPKEIRYLGDMQRLVPQPGEIFVLTTERILTCEQRAMIKQAWDAVMPGKPLLLIDGGVRLEVVGQPVDGDVI